MNGDSLLEKSVLFDKYLGNVKKEIDSNFSWYPYGSLNNFIHLREMLNKRPIDSLVGDHSKILDIGAADGDLSFFFESLGYKVDIIDNGPTNFNSLKGARLLKDRLNSSVGIYEIDIDSQFKTQDERYDLVLFLGILYHLKNPYYILEALSRIAKHLVLSTRVAQFTPDGTSISRSSLAYLLAPDESNNDATNYWIFSNEGLKRLLDRSGWEILEIMNVGDTKKSNPRDQDHDERAFAILRSKKFHIP
jgi:2-polyprenyl-3-methyl-5-hydroxy-6-metoxy-1,4-benzoquinol methylase